ncbi:uncharacterized protein LOC107432422 isoform X1 [Ziziphus jujuba]|uniref:Uncharacterized protein LOC107432422 isoform X1 n=2 Tax=Ziziphus jujuba TaxID=326968 RepID=A0A6P4AM58_ZIZJJ|nr:uncharacterized protein LOC107432422 isoform X1 [Ziziphus jujuba]XP_015899038.3 uncharacterized protein LOC107432422 isoform X1 [Ziziphus jujuba]XP_015899041.3 uncharacterized protein LOC107432422 isoform X1 [Ziziphus jujuba]XP_015899043.3 uncharacterized protein LOC107432422 isoform X1 [Ziziphus jujuba]XP_015899044.3 uncharacterized protein LOC107432422 isoform X1 [Ziziphus jujuba]XP_048321292.2 uncharacterized protein LOC107432422 isoform X1 [Ziziphus jujuba]
MKEVDKSKITNNNQTRRSKRTERRDQKLNQRNSGKTLNGKDSQSRASYSKPDSSTLVSDLNTGTEPSEVYENMVIHYVDDVNRFEEPSQDLKANEMISKEIMEEVLDGNSTDLDGEHKQGKEEVSDPETTKDSLSSQGDPLTTEDEKAEKVSKVAKSNAKSNSIASSQRGSKEKSDREISKPQARALRNTPKKSNNANGKPSRVTTKNSYQSNSKSVNVPSKPSSESSEGLDDKPAEEVKGSDTLDEIPNGAQLDEISNGFQLDETTNGAHSDEISNGAHSDETSYGAHLDENSNGENLDETSNGAHLDKTLPGAQNVGSDDDAVYAEENGEHQFETSLQKKIEEMEMRIEKLEEELREVAALEISLYSIVPEHGSSAHKVHTPARRLSRLYIHACKHWTQYKRATIAKNTVSGLILIAKSCGNDVPRLTFWLSNTVVLREVISQAFGGSCNSSPATKFAKSHGNGKGNEMKSTALKWKGSPGSKQINGFMQFVDDWQETGTFTAALEKVESWIFSRIVESVWWQAMTPNMQSPVDNLSNDKTSGRLLGPALGDQQQGSFSISLWKNAFQDASQRLCPLRAGGHECGCLPLLARMVMEQCVARLDVAMFNAILRESAHEIPTDPVSDPILDPKVLPIPAGDLSFGSGAQLKNSVGSWSRWLTDMFGMDADDAPQEDDDGQGGDGEPKSFLLLNSLSDLLMLPKDMLMDRSIRKEVCPSISLPLIKRILCNFTPDEFCPDAVPGAVLEALNAESIVERRLSGDSLRSFPYAAAPVVYTPPPSTAVAEKISEAGGRSELTRNVSVLQRKGYTSDEELEELDCPLASIIEKLPSSPNNIENGNGKHKEDTRQTCLNERYELLLEVWSV